MASLTIEAYCAAIRDAIAGNDLALAAQQARVGLENHPKEPEFAKIEIVALIKMEKPAQALDVLERARGARLLAPKAMSYEAAYCHFALENYAKAEDALKSVEAGPAADRLAAQIAYKSNRFETCIEIYERLLTSVAAASPEHDEILLNLAAAKAAAAQVAGRKQIGAAADALIESYELMFNQATELLAYGQAKEAAKLLEAAAVRAEAVLTEDNWIAEDIQSEVSTIDAQRAVALQCLGKISDARAIYARLLSGKSLDRATRGAVVHNAAVLMARAGGTTDFLLASQIKRAIQIPGTSTSGLSRYQRALMAYNMAVVQFFQQQFAAARR
ncbi:Signal recognition particle core component, partial [Coemansia sp. RSA 2610]